MDEAMQVFDRRLVRRHRDRAAPRLAEHDFLLREVAERLAERLEDVTRRFPLALDLGCHDGVLQRTLGNRGGVETLVQCDLSPVMARRARRNGQPALAADEEALPFAETSFDAVFSLLSLHWVNDLPGALIQIRRALKPDGLFLAALFGGETLTELRGALMQAEIEEEGGAGPRVSPFADVPEAGGLLQRAGFALPVADVDSITVSYPDAFGLMQDLRGMGETNAVTALRRTASRRATLMRAAALYGERHGGPDGRLPATFQVVYLTAWAPHESQQQPLRPGSAKARLADALGTEERSAGEKAGPGGPRRRS
jgi:SAM-dependent methyltransferase